MSSTKYNCLKNLVISENCCNFIVQIKSFTNNNRYDHRGQSYGIILYCRRFLQVFLMLWWKNRLIRQMRSFCRMSQKYNYRTIFHGLLFLNKKLITKILFFLTSFAFIFFFCSFGATICTLYIFMYF